MRRGVLHRAHDAGMRVAEDRRSPRADVVDVALAVGVAHVRALAAREEARRAADGAKRAHRRVDAARNRALRTGEELVVAAHGARFLGKHDAIAAAARVTCAEVVVREDVGDHGDRVDARVDQQRRVAGRDAADGDDRHAERLRRAARSETSARRASGFTRDGKKLPNAT